MSEVKPISPLLDGFSLGNPMSDHCGVKCCPAIKENTDKKYIVKVISVPASQVQMDALLLAGAYKDPADAMEYFRRLGEDILAEAERLKMLSKLDGFLPYEGWQMVPITRRRLGYEIYLVGSYKRSLEKYIKSHSMTHLEAINLGLDLCAALSVARESGAIYAALKPSNVFVSDKKDYRIGDLGFIPLDSLHYSALPDRHLSSYTPPALHDPMASLNLTVDTYAVGMILYRLYNDGRLPFKGKKAPDEELPSPANADYELSEIIMKAIHPDPSQRWTDPADLGKALAAYMQRNSINDTPITPYIPLVISPDEKNTVTDNTAETDSETIPTEPDTDSIVDEQTPVSTEEATVDESDETTIEQIPLTPEEPDSVQDPAHTDVEPAEDTEGTECIDSISPEASQIIEKADDLIAHEIPDDIVVSSSDAEPDPFAFASEDESDEAKETAETEIPEGVPEDIVPEPKKVEKKKRTRKFADPKHQRKVRRVLSGIAFSLVLCILGMLGYLYYQNIYLQPIYALSAESTQNEITVSIDTDIDPSLLKITCTDSFGNAKTKPVSTGTVVFENLQSNTMYTIHVGIDGFHKLTGETKEICTTAAQTSIVDFTYIAGVEDGSVQLSFSVNGKEPNDWTVFYSAEGEEETRKTFSGHSVNISNLVIGKTYTFRLETGENISLDGQTTLELLASKNILAEDLHIDSQNGTDITVSWKTPGDLVVDNWTVKCYSGSNYEKEITVTETQAVFSGIDPACSYTIEVIASGMTQGVRTEVSANPITIGSVKTNDSTYNKLKITWDFTGTAPKDGWLLTYSYVDGQKNAIKCAKSSAEITPVIPGAQYQFTIQATDNSTVYNGTHSYSAPAAEPFNKHNLAADKLTVELAKTPADPDWYFESLADNMITSSFQTGETISLGLRSTDSFYLTGAEVDILYVTRDAYGNIVPEMTAEDSISWKKIWDGGDVKIGELTLPFPISNAGSYVLTIYFDGMHVAELDFTVN